VVFCRLLDAGHGGNFRVGPADPFSVERRYRDATNILETTFTTATGRVRITDLMPIHQRTKTEQGYDVGTYRRILRLIEGLTGEVDLEIFFKPTFGYALAETEIRQGPGGAIARAEGQFLTLACPGIDLELVGDGAFRGHLRVGQGEQRWVVLTGASDEDTSQDALAPSDCQEQFQATIDYWEKWASFCTYQGPYRAEVLRSTLTLKLLTYEPTGAVVAAPTTSLPERIGGTRNWDYRYSWLRDSALMLYSLMTVGYNDEAADYFQCLVRTTEADPSPIPQIMYRIDGDGICAR
jgi:GH15 family glucan-1,4-alpha-glucosidase